MRGSIMPSGRLISGANSICPSTSCSRSMPGAISSRRSPFSVSRNTARSVTYIVSWPSSRARLPLKVICSTAGTNFRL